MNSKTIGKLWFVLSTAFLAFLYGYASHAWGWFPHRHVQQAWTAARHNVLNPSPVPLRPFAFDRTGAQGSRPDEIQSGMTLITSAWKERGEWTVGSKLIDKDGTTVHEWLLDKEEIFTDQLDQRKEVEEQDLHGSLLLDDGHVVVNMPYVGMARVNSCGDVVWTLPEGNHHSISRAEDGSFWVPGVSSERRAGSDRFPDGYPGLNGKSVWIDRILKVSPDGTVRRDINVLDLLYANGLERYIPKTLGGLQPDPSAIPEDVTHLNDIEPLPSTIADEYPLFDAGDLVVSLRSLSLVLVFDPETLDVKWHTSDPFIYQHDPDFVGDGWIGVFDNNYDLTPYSNPEVRGTMLGGNRIVGVQPHSDSMAVWFPTDASEHVYTHVRGKWQQLANGNLLLTEASAGRALEVNRQGETVWEWIHEPTEDATVPSVSNAVRHDLTREDVAQWACSSVDTTQTRGTE